MPLNSATTIITLVIRGYIFSGLPLAILVATKVGNFGKVIVEKSVEKL